MASWFQSHLELLLPEDKRSTSQQTFYAGWEELKTAAERSYKLYDDARARDLNAVLVALQETKEAADCCIRHVGADLNLTQEDALDFAKKLYAGTQKEVA
jgi:hypothetical protein